MKRRLAWAASFGLLSLALALALVVSGANWPSVPGTTAPGFVIEDGAGNKLGVTGSPLVTSGGSGSGCLVSGATGVVYNVGDTTCATLTGSTGQVVTLQTGAAPVATTLSCSSLSDAATSCSAAPTVAAGTPNLVVGTTGLAFTVSTTVSQNTQSGNSAYTLLSTDNAKSVIRTNTVTQTDSVPQATGAFATGFGFSYITSTNGNTLTSTTSTINGIAGATGIKLGPRQVSDWLADAANNWRVALGVPQPPTQTSTLYLDDDLSWKASTGTGAGVRATSPTITTPTIAGALTTNVTGSTQCVHANSSGVLTGTGTDCGAGIGGGVLQYSDNGLTLTAATRYVPIGGSGTPSSTEADYATKAPSTTTINNLQVNLSADPGSGQTLTVTLRKNNADQTLTCTVTGPLTPPAAVCQDITHSISITQNDLLAWKVVTSGTFVATPSLTILANGGTTNNGITGSGTANTLAKFTSSAAAGNASITDDGSIVTLPNALSISGTLSPTALSGSVNDYNPTSFSTATALRVDGGVADRNITGLAGGVDGRIITITNIGATNNLVLTNQDAASSAANRFLSPADTILPINTALAFRYDGASSRWRPWSRALSNTGVTAGSYTSANITVDAAGRVSAAANGGAAAGTPAVSAISTSALTRTSSTALTDIPGMTLALLASKSYVCRGYFPMTSAASGGFNLALVNADTLTVTSIVYGSIGIAAGNASNTTTLGNAVGNTGATTIAELFATINVNVAGTLKLQGAQFTSNATATVFLVNSNFTCVQQN